MPTIQFGGLSSGLDTKAIIDALMGVERRGLDRLLARRTTLQGRADAYAKVRAALSDLRAKLVAFTVGGVGAARSATSSDPAILTATATSKAVPGSHTISVDQLATATRARSQAPIGSPITQAMAGTALADLNLPGTVTAGSLGLVVDGTIVSVTVGDPATTTLADVLDAVAGAIGGVVATSDPGATVSASVVNNRIVVSLSNATLAHEIRFGVAGDSSNFFGIVGLAGVGGTNLGPGTASLSSGVELGVVRTSVPLDSAGLSGLTSTSTGQLVINRVAIAYDTATDSLATILTRTATGPAAIAIEDASGTLAAALGLAPGTTAAQTLGQVARLTVDGQTLTSESNQVSGAIEGVTLELRATGGPVVLGVGVDRAAIRSALEGVVAAYNALADLLDRSATAAPGATAPLRGDATVAGLALDLRGRLMAPASAWPTGLRSLGELGISSGPLGSGSAGVARLQLDAAALDRALDADPARVAALLGSAEGVLAPVVDRLTELTRAGGLLDGRAGMIDVELRDLDARRQREEVRLADVQARLERKYAQLEALLSQLGATSAAVARQANAFTVRRDA
jgi:flagellar hook-associated protein 2